jgi:hypothetical protein
MRTTTWSALPRFRALLRAVLPSVCASVLLAACAQPGRAPDAPPPLPVAALPPLPASFESTPACATCGSVALILRKDGGFLLRERIGRSDFSDFGRWTLLPDRTISLQGGREKRRYAPRADGSLDALEGGDGTLWPKAAIEPIRGPFRMTGLYDGRTFRDCRTGIAWPLDDSRAGGSLREQYLKSAPGLAGQPALVAIDARFDEEDPSREEVRILRLPAILSATACPAAQ